MEELARLKADFRLHIVEDCAQSIGASHRGTRTGTVGQLAATSFYPTKNLGALGDAGALLTNDAALAAKARTLRNYGQTEHYVHAQPGLNSRLDELLAAIMHDAFLPHLADWTETRRRTAAKYVAQIKHPAIQLLAPEPDMTPVWHLFPIITGEGLREQLQSYLKNCGVMTGIHYPRLISEQAALKERTWERAAEPENARRFTSRELSLPIHPFLTEQEIDTVIAACNAWTI
jgi:dTDP-3-amino-3,4,6-trideoxy-alpha-D-glucose transaminase